jgi:hypothetical protein
MTCADRVSSNRCSLFPLFSFHFFWSGEICINLVCVCSSAGKREERGREREDMAISDGCWTRVGRSWYFWIDGWMGCPCGIRCGVSPYQGYDKLHGEVSARMGCCHCSRVVVSKGIQSCSFVTRVVVKCLWFSALCM